MKQNATGKDLLHLSENSLRAHLLMGEDDVRTFVKKQQELLHLEVPFSSWPKSTTVDWLCTLQKDFVDLYGRNALENNVSGSKLTKTTREELLTDLCVENEDHAVKIWSALLTLRHVEPPFSKWTPENVATW